MPAAGGLDVVTGEAVTEVVGAVVVVGDVVVPWEVVGWLVVGRVVVAWLVVGDGSSEHAAAPSVTRPTATLPRSARNTRRLLGESEGTVIPRDGIRGGELGNLSSDAPTATRRRSALPPTLARMIWKIEIGTVVLYGIRDGATNRDPLEYLIGSTPEAWSGYEHFLNADGTMPNSYSCYLVDTGSAWVMIDAGFGFNAPDGSNAGDMPGALETLGVAPPDIDHVVFTHLHPDHILGSLAADGVPLFGNAPHWTLVREVKHWRSGTDDRSRSITQVADALDEAALLNAVDEPGQVVPGVTTVAAYGHTPGPTAVRVSSGEDELIIVGDLTFSPVQIHYPEWAFPFDVDKPAAATTRAEFFEMLADASTPFAAGHYAQPGYGRIVVTAAGRKYEALPVERVG